MHFTPRINGKRLTQAQAERVNQIVMPFYMQDISYKYNINGVHGSMYRPATQDPSVIRKLIDDRVRNKLRTKSMFRKAVGGLALTLNSSFVKARNKRKNSK